MSDSPAWLGAIRGRDSGPGRPILVFLGPRAWSGPWQNTEYPHGQPFIGSGLCCLLSRHQLEQLKHTEFELLGG